MAKRRLKNKLIDISDINEEMVLIKGSNIDYITPSGKVYTYYEDTKFYPKKEIVNKVNGYVYVNITLNGIGCVQRKLHRLIAEAFIPNDDKTKNVVMHLDNNKQNNDICNLKWGSTSENTKQAYDDGLAKTDKGFDDNQSMPIVEFDLEFNIKNIYGSVSIASKESGMTKSGILFQANHLMKDLTKKPRCGKYFRFLSEYQEKGFIL